MADSDKGFASMSKKEAHKIQSMGGKASHEGDNTAKSSKGSGTTSKRGSNLTQEDRAKGGENSHSGGRRSSQ